MNGLKILSALLVLLLLPFTSNAEYLSTKGLLDTAVYMQLNIPIGGNDNIATVEVRFAINRAMQQLCFDAPAFERDTVITGGTGTTDSYSMPSDFVALASVGKYSGDTAIFPLSIVSSSEAWESRGGMKGAVSIPDKQENPRKVWTYNKKLYLYPFSTEADTFLVSYFAICSSLTVAASAVQILEGYRDAIVDYACYLLALRGGQFAEANAFYAAYTIKVGKATGGQ